MGGILRRVWEGKEGEAGGGGSGGGRVSARLVHSRTGDRARSDRVGGGGGGTHRLEGPYDEELCEDVEGVEGEAEEAEGGEEGEEGEEVVCAGGGAGAAEEGGEVVALCGERGHAGV